MKTPGHGQWLIQLQRQSACWKQTGAGITWWSGNAGADAD